MKKFNVYVAGEYYGKTFAETLEEARKQIQRHPNLQNSWPVTITEIEETTMEDRIRTLYERNYDTFEGFKDAVMELIEAEEGCWDE